MNRLGGPDFSFYPINMAARACHQDETKSPDQSELERLDDCWTVPLLPTHEAIMLVGSVAFFFTVTWERYDELLGCVSVLPEASKAIYRMWVQVETRACACICPTSGR